MNAKDIKDVLRRVLNDLDCVDYIEFITMSEQEIQRYSDMDYTGGPKDVLVVVYKSEYYAAPRYIWDWEFTRPDELVNSLEI